MPSYLDNNINAQVLALMDRTGRRQIDQTRYATEDTAGTIKQRGAAFSQALQTLPDAYMKGSRYKYENEESQGRIKKQRRDDEAAQTEEEWANKVAGNGMTNRDNMRQEQMREAQLGNQVKEAQIKNYEAEAYAKRNPAAKPVSVADQKGRVDIATNLFAGAKDPASVAAAEQNARDLGLSNAEIAAAKGAAAGLDAKETKTKEPTDTAKRSGAFAKRATQANSIIEQLEAGGYNPADPDRAFRDLPIIRNFTMEPKDRQYKSAQNEWMSAVLRDESGASIAPSEYDNYREIYFASPNDDENTKLQKAAQRKAVEATMYDKSGGSASPDDVVAYKVPTKAAKPDGKTAIGATKPKTVIQNGHTYTLDPQTGEYK
jgi:hypothetical protein